MKLFDHNSGILKSIVLIIAFIVLFHTDLFSRIFYVSSTATGSGDGTQNNPFTLQQAISTAISGDTFYLAIGNYNITSVNFNKMGTQADPIRWIGEISPQDYAALSSDGTTSTLIRNSTSSTNGPVTMSGSYNTFERIIFQQNYPARQLISISGTGVILDSCAVKYPSNVSSSSNHTIIVSGVRVTFRYSHFYNGSRTIIWVRKNGGTQGDFFTMEHCILTHATNHPPIQIMPSTNSTDTTTIKRPIVRNCIFIDNPYSDGIYSRYCEQFAFYNNLFIRSSIPYSIDIHTGFHYPDGALSDTCNSKGGIIAYNTIIENGNSNIIFNRGTNQINFVNNMFYSTYSNPDFIFRLDSDWNAIFRHNNDYNFYYFTNHTINLPAPNGVRGTWGANSSVWFPNWDNVTGQETHTIVDVEPKFTSVADDDYSPLNGTAPQVGAGTPITTANGYWMNITTDFFGNPRDPIHPTIGAIEFQGNNQGTYLIINEGWNCISIPRLSDNMSADFLLPSRTSEVYSYINNSYNAVENLENGKGYMVEFGNLQYIFIEGEILSYPIVVNQGWNLIGPFNTPVSISQIQSIPENIISSEFFAIYNNQYVASDILLPGKGYWIKVSQNGTFYLNINTMGKVDEKKLFAKIEQNWGRINITDNEGKTITLYITDKKPISGQYEFPPIVPHGIFDARFSGGSFVENVVGSKNILINSNKFPLTVTTEDLIIKVVSNGKLLKENLEAGDELKIFDNKITSLEVTVNLIKESVTSYGLNQNYPNPFNPNTTINFSIPIESNVNLSIYNVLGELVLILVDEEKEPGYYKYDLNASNLASGVYLYRIKAGDFVETKKMVLIK